MKDGYKRVSKFYNGLSSLYSLGAVGRCRSYALTELEPGMKVCFLGVGEGSEAVKAIEMGACVTVVDSSRSMLDHFRSSVAKIDAATAVTVYHGDVLEFCESEDESYDLVVSHFFLNVFPEGQMLRVLECGLGLCSSKGSMVIGDFWHDTEASKLVQCLQKMNWYVALFLFQWLADNPKHPIYRYDTVIQNHGFQLVREKVFNVLGIPMYRSIVVQKSTVTD